MSESTDTPQSDFGVLLVNLGSPDSTSVPDVRRYLHQFLMDGRVIDAPWPIRKMIVCLAILPTRPPRTAEAYRKIWWDEGSPLVVLSQRVCTALQKRVDYPVAVGMRYGNPSIEAGIQQLMDANPGMRRIYLLPLYPHYAMSTVETVQVEAERVMRRHPEVKLETHPVFYDDALYLDAMAANIREALPGDVDHVLFSYHGLPERHLHKTDPTGSHCLASANCCETDSPAHARCYRAQAYATTRGIAERLQLKPGSFSNAFQSRLGRDPWLTPFTDLTIEEFAKNGVKRLAVVCPSFVSDCLETLEEIGMEAAESFTAAGGESVHLIPCLNERPDWIETLQTWCNNARTD